MPPPRRRTKILAAAKSRDVSCAAETKFSPQQSGGFAAAERIRLLFAPGLGCCNRMRRGSGKTCNKNIDNNYEMMYITGIKRIAEQKGA